MGKKNYIYYGTEHSTRTQVGHKLDYNNELISILLTSSKRHSNTIYLTFLVSYKRHWGAISSFHSRTVAWISNVTTGGARHKSTGHSGQRTITCRAVGTILEYSAHIKNRFIGLVISSFNVCNISG